MSAEPPAEVREMVERWRAVEAAAPERQAIIRGTDGIPRLVSARFLARMDATCRILRAAGIKVTLLPPLLKGVYPVEFD